MSHRPNDASRRDEALWALTGLLIGLALWLATDNLGVGIGVGVALGAGLGGQEHARRSRGGSGDVGGASGTHRHT